MKNTLKKRTIRKKTSRREQSFAMQIIKGVLRLIALVLFFFLLYYISRLETFTISAVEIQGGETISHEEIENLTNAELEGAYFRLVPKRFTYLYPHDRIIEVVSDVPRVHNVEVSRTSKKKLTVSFDEYVPHALWCSDQASTTPCFFLNKHGYLFAEAPLLHGGTFVRHFIATTSEFHTGQVIDQHALESIDSFIENAQTILNFRISNIVYMPNDDITFEINGGGSILASLKKDMVTTLENVATVLNSEEFKHIEPGNFKYIDARFENKIFVNENFATSTDLEEELSE